MSKRICVFGDSITQGYRDFEKGGWVMRLWLKSSIKNGQDIFNLGINGSTIKDIDKRFDDEVKARKPETIIFNVGTNDSLFDKNINNNWVDIKLFENIFNKLIKKSKKISKNIVCLEIMHVVDDKTSPVSWNENLFYNNETIKKYNKVLKDFCETEKVHFIEMFDLLDNEDLPDGLHPNAEGHRKMFERVRDYLVENKIVE